MTSIGFVGLGRMGAGMAARLLDHVDALVVHDLAHGPVESLVGQGATAAGSAREVGAAADIVFVSLPTPAIVQDAVLGDDGIAAGGRVRAIVDLSTSGPQTAQRLAQALAEKGIASYDAPVSGGVKGARDGKLALMASGPQRGWAEVEPLLARMGTAFYMGETSGAGQTMKLVNNLLGAVAIAVTAEGMTMGIKAGLDPQRMIEVLNQSTGRNSATQDKWPRSVLPRTFDFGFAAALSLKDMRLASAEAHALQTPFAFGDMVVALLQRTLDAHGDDADFTAMAKIVEADAGIDPDRPS